MKESLKYIILIIVIIAIIGGLAIFFNFQGEINNNSKDNSSSVLNTSNNINNGFNEAKNTNKSLFIVFKSDSCFYCQKLEQDTLSDEKVISALDKKYVSIVVNIDENPGIASKYNVFATPVMLFLDSNGNEQQRIDGYQGPEELLEYL